MIAQVQRMNQAWGLGNIGGPHPHSAEQTQLPRASRALPYEES